MPDYFLPRSNKQVSEAIQNGDNDIVIPVFNKLVDECQHKGDNLSRVLHNNFSVLKFIFNISILEINQPAEEVSHADSCDIKHLQSFLGLADLE